MRRDILCVQVVSYLCAIANHHSATDYYLDIVRQLVYITFFCQKWHFWTTLSILRCINWRSVLIVNLLASWYFNKQSRLSSIYFQGPVRMLVPLRPNHATLMQFENQEGCIDSKANVHQLQELIHLLFSKEIGFSLILFFLFCCWLKHALRFFLWKSELACKESMGR